MRVTSIMCNHILCKTLQESSLSPFTSWMCGNLYTWQTSESISYLSPAVAKELHSQKETENNYYSGTFGSRLFFRTSISRSCYECSNQPRSFLPTQQRPQTTALLRSNSHALCVCVCVLHSNMGGTGGKDTPGVVYTPDGPSSSPAI